MYLGEIDNLSTSRMGAVTRAPGFIPRNATAYAARQEKIAQRAQAAIDAKAVADAAKAASDAADLQRQTDNLRVIVSAGVPLTSSQLSSVVDAILKLPQERIQAIYDAQVQLAPVTPAPSSNPGLHGLGGWFTSIRNAVESVAVAPVTLLAPHGAIAGAVSIGAQAKAITFTRLRDAAETVGVLVANYYVPGISIALSRYVVSKGSQSQLNSDVGKVAQVVSSAAGAYRLITATLSTGAATPVASANASPILQTVPAGYAEAGYTGAASVAPASYGAVASGASTTEAAAWASGTVAAPSVTGATQLVSSLTQKGIQAVETEAGKLVTGELLSTQTPGTESPAPKSAASAKGLLAFVPLLLLLK
jgi:hypothetical protein